MDKFESEPEILALAFIAFLFSIFNVLVARFILVRFFLKKDKSIIKLHPYEVAYLAQGKLVCIQSVIAYLMSKGIVQTKGASKKEVISIEGDIDSQLNNLRGEDKAKEFYREADENIFSLEKEVCLSVNGKSRHEIEDAKWPASISYIMENIEEKLASQALRFSNSRLLINKTVLILVSTFPVALILVTRIVELSSLGRSIMIESIVTLASIGIAASAMYLSTTKTIRGKNFIKAGESEFNGLVRAMKESENEISAEDFVRAFSLSGGLIYLNVKQESQFKEFFFPEIRDLSSILDGEE